MLTFSLAIALSLFFVHNNLRLADKLFQVDNSEKSLEWAETDTDSDSDPIVNSDLLRVVVVHSQLNAYVLCMF